VYQCTENNAKFFQLYSKITTDKKLEAEVMKTSKNVHKLHKNALLPNIALQDITGKIVAIKDLINTKTVLFFWTKQSESQAIFSHKKVDELKAKYPNIRFISINIGNTKSEWLNELKKNKFTSNPNTIELFSSNFDEIKEKWVINKIHRTMIINANGTINNAFVSLFDANFENKLNN
jgi:peroxiredoxin